MQIRPVVSAAISMLPLPANGSWHAGVHARTVAESLEAARLQIRLQIIWWSRLISSGK
jgi:hypothetical protein